MTLSLILRDSQTGDFGAAISSSSPAVAARCINLAPGVGGANSQNVTDPRLGFALIDELRTGLKAQDALDKVVREANPETIGYRQLLVLDTDGTAAVYTGDRALGTFGSAARTNGVAGGNMLANLGVLDALVDTALATEGPLERRLMAGLKAAVAAGGEEGPLHSAGLSVVTDAGWRVTDLRVDWADNDPIAELEALLDRWMLERDDYVNRGINPHVAPSYGVPGDE